MDSQALHAILFTIQGRKALTFAGLLSSMIITGRSLKDLIFYQKIAVDVEKHWAPGRLIHFLHLYAHRLAQQYLTYRNHLSRERARFQGYYATKIP